MGRGNSSQWRNFRQIDLIVPASISECNFDDREEDGSAEPWASVKVLANAIVGDLAEGRKWGLRSHSAEACSFCREASNCAAPIDSPNPKIQPGRW